MGCLRFILATSVVAAHSTPIFGLSFTGGLLAVQLFFIISGYYMALILESKYLNQPSGYQLFISNRFLRIFPNYLVVLVLSLGFYAVASIYLKKPVDRLELWQQAWTEGRFLPLGLIGLSHLTIIGQEFWSVPWFEPSSGFLLEPSGGGQGADATPGWRFLFVPQAWTIGVELTFYFLAPFLVRRSTRQIFLLILIGLFGRWCVSRFVSEPLSIRMLYYLFPFHLHFFCFGILAFKFRDQMNRMPRLMFYVLAGILTGLIFFSANLKHGAIPWLAAGCLAVVLPGLFDATKNNKWDRTLGELSYPIYICHVFVKWLLLAVATVIGFKGEVNGLILLIASVLLSWLLYSFVDRPIDRYRQNRLTRSRQGAIGNG